MFCGQKGIKQDNKNLLTMLIDIYDSRLQSPLLHRIVE